MEMDLTQGSQLAYLAPNMLLSIADFFNHIQLVIQTHGYDTWQAGESNLLLTRSLIGRLSNTSYTGFRYSINNVSDYLTSHGVQAIPGQRYTTEELRGRRWILRPPQQPVVQHPQRAVTRVRSDGSILLRFSNYYTTPPAEELHRGELDEETTEELALPVIEMIEEEFINPFACSTTDAGQKPGDELKLRIFEEEELEDSDDEQPEEPWVFRGWTFDGDDDNDDDGGERQPEQHREPEQTWVFHDEDDGEDQPFFNRHSPRRWYDMPESDGWNDWDDYAYETDEYLAYLASQESDEGAPQFDEPEEEELPQPTLLDEQAVHMACAGTEEELEYPLMKAMANMALSGITGEVSSVYAPPRDTSMTPPVYPPGSTSQPVVTNVEEIRGRIRNIGGRPKREGGFQLPSAQVNQGVMLVLPADVGLYEDAIARWESITINVVNERVWTDNQAKVMFIENLLGETEKLVWIQ